MDKDRQDQPDAKKSLCPRLHEGVSVQTLWKNTATGISDSDSMGLSGPAIGLRGDYSIDKMFDVYASATYLKTKIENKDSFGTITDKAPGTAVELDVKTKFCKELSGTVGYEVESTKEDKTNVRIPSQVSLSASCTYSSV